MKKINNKGFVLAETLVVTVFLMILFTMIYSNFYPLIGEYEKRENYDDVDGKYVSYWMKKLVEDQNYSISEAKKTNMRNYGFFRLECSDLNNNSQQTTLCNNLLQAYEINGCQSIKDKENGGDTLVGCEVFVTHYRIGGTTPDFKNTVKQNLKKYKENCSESYSTCKQNYIKTCVERKKNSGNVSDNNINIDEYCAEDAEENIFSSGFQDYVTFLPDYTTPSLNLAKYRVIAVVHHTKDYNNYLTYSTTEVNR